MTPEPVSLLNLIHATGAVSLWNAATGPVFWYAAGVPGPFYVNTEKVIGPHLAESLLETINTIIAGSNDPATRVSRLEHAIMEAYNTTPQYQDVINALIATVRTNFPPYQLEVISGGERRDWLFSIPVAKVMGIRHLYLFKNGMYFCPEGVEEKTPILHIADLINNAASYFDLWLPILQKAKLTCIGTAAINARGTAGTDKLLKAGIPVATVNRIDHDFFAQSCAAGLIDAKRLDELTLFFQSSEEWGRTYLTATPAIFGIESTDKKSFERLRSFFSQDPWGIKAKNPEFHKTMQGLISARKAALAKE